VSVDTNQAVNCKCENCGASFKIKLSTYYQRKKKGYMPGRFCERCKSTSSKGLRSKIKTNDERYSYKWGE